MDISGKITDSDNNNNHYDFHGTSRLDFINGVLDFTRIPRIGTIKLANVPDFNGNQRTGIAGEATMSGMV